MDSVTNEVLNITVIHATVPDCFEGKNTTDTKSRSCNGRGTCSLDPNIYDGHFVGCDCDSGYDRVVLMTHALHFWVTHQCLLSGFGSKLPTSF